MNICALVNIKPSKGLQVWNCLRYSNINMLIILHNRRKILQWARRRVLKILKEIQVSDLIWHWIRDGHSTKHAHQRTRKIFSYVDPWWVNKQWKRKNSISKHSRDNQYNLSQKNTYFNPFQNSLPEKSVPKRNICLGIIRLLFLSSN